MKKNIKILVLAFLLVILPHFTSAYDSSCSDDFSTNTSDDYNFNSGQFTITGGEGIVTAAGAWQPVYSKTCSLDPTKSYILHTKFKIDLSSSGGALVEIMKVADLSSHWGKRGVGGHYGANALLGYKAAVSENNTVLSSVGGDYVNNVYKELKILFNATSKEIKEKRWDAGGAEPSAWNLTGTGGEQIGTNLSFAGYQAGAGLTIDWWNVTQPGGGATPPGINVTVTLNLPEDTNRTKAYPKDINWSFTPVTTDAALTNCSLWTNESGSWVWEAHITSVTNNTQNTIYNQTGRTDQDGAVLWNVQCCTAGECAFATGNFTVEVDVTSPTITLNPNNAFNTTNTSTITQYKDVLFPINITFTDDLDLYTYQINITTGGSGVWNVSNSSIPASTTTYEYFQNLNTSSWSAGIYSIEITASDRHTISQINDYSVIKGKDTLFFDTEEGNSVSVKGDKAIKTDYVKSRDRYSLMFDYSSSGSKDYFVESDKKIEYFPLSTYKAHFVIWNNDLKTGNWIDFEGLSGVPVVTKISDYKYKISFSSAGKNVVFNSIGGLNSKTEYYSWYKGSYSTNVNATGRTQKSYEYMLNVTINTDYIQGINASLLWNGTNYSLSKDDKTTYIEFSSNITTPSTPGSYDFNWSFNVTQKSGGVYNVSFVESQTLNNAELNITFYDEQTSILLSGYNVTLDLIHSSYAENFSTTTGKLSLDLNYTGDYTLRYTAENYDTRLYYFTLATEDFINQSLYLLSNTTAEDITITVYDETSDLVDGARVKALRYYLANNSYLIQEMCDTDVEGQCVLHLERYTEWYKFIVEYGGETKKITEPTYVYSTSIVFRINIAESIGETYYNYESIDYDPISFNNDTNNFAFTYNDVSGVASEFCLRVYYLNKLENRIGYSNNCSTSTSATLMLNVENVTGRTYQAEAEVTIDSNVYVFSSLLYSFRQSSSMGKLGLFAIIILTITFAMMGYWNPTVAVMLAPLPLLLGSKGILHIVEFSTGLAIMIQISALIIAYMVSNKS